MSLGFVSIYPFITGVDCFWAYAIIYEIRW